MTFMQIGPQDMGRKREFDVNGVKFQFEAHDPYGFVTVFCASNKKLLEGQFTSFTDAERGATTYANQPKNFIKEKVV